jgi:hypothetical protein
VVVSAKSLAIASLCGALLVASSTGEAVFIAGSTSESSSESSAAGLDETARFLAGKGVAPDSALADHARTDTYAEYAEQIATGWKQFEQPNLEKMRTWWAGRAPATYSTVFYPFGGPDIGNALALFPDADNYLLFGLESPGAIPDLQSMDDEAIGSGLKELQASLRTIFEVNYFFTKAMAKKLGKSSFDSVTGLLLFFLAENDCVVTRAKTIAVGRVPGVEIAFRRQGGKRQTLRYFMVNVEDAALAKRSPDFLPYLESQGRFVTMIKAASYLMHRDGIQEPAHFEQIRSLILTHSDFVVQDDSGVPLRLFTRDAWKLGFHGVYDAPTPEFEKYLQSDLSVEMHRNSTGRLPFNYGYAYKQGASNLVTAERIQ